ncbi:MAG: hypothetical protein WHX52_14750 [Anaerolineae bacterium]
MGKKLNTYLLLTLLAALLSGCDFISGLLKPKPDVPPAVEMLPDLPDHTVVEGQTLTEYLGSLAEGASLLAGRPDLAALALGVDKFIGCYQDVGAVQARVYSNKQNPLSAGAVAIADRNALLDPRNLLACLKPSAEAGEAGIQSFAIEPCSASYTLTKDDNEFYILYAGTTQEICQAFCAQLEGCTAHK